MNSDSKKFYVFVDDNSHYMDETCRRLHGTYNSYEEAFNVCRFLVEDSVREFFDYDKTGEDIFSLYMLYGIEPWFDPDGEGEPFSAFDYARQHINNLIKLKPFLD